MIPLIDDNAIRLANFAKSTHSTIKDLFASLCKHNVKFVDRLWHKFPNYQSKEQLSECLHIAISKGNISVCKWAMQISEKMGYELQPDINCVIYFTFKPIDAFEWALENSETPPNDTTLWAMLQTAVHTDNLILVARILEMFPQDHVADPYTYRKVFYSAFQTSKSMPYLLLKRFPIDAGDYVEVTASVLMWGQTELFTHLLENAPRQRRRKKSL